jgi:LacI family transcriptional regulator
MNEQTPDLGAGSPPNGAVTIKQVAAEAGVSTATVSRVMVGSARVTRKKREKVCEAVRKLNYHPNQLARGLRGGLRTVVGVIVPDLQNPFFPAVVHGVEKVLSEAGYTLILGHSGGKAENEKIHLAMLRREGAAGLILIPEDRSGAVYRELRSWDIPVVAVDRTPKGLRVDTVSTNNREGLHDAVAHLLSHGYREIAFINGTQGLSITRDRLDGYCDAMREAGVEVREAYIVHSDYRQDGGYAAMTHLLNLPKPPRSVVCANNLMTLGALQAIHESGAAIPEQVAIVGFDDMPWATSLRPPLTVVTQPAEDLGRIAAQLLLERFQDPKRLVRQVVLPTQLIVRASCGAHPPIKAEDRH